MNPFRLRTWAGIACVAALAAAPAARADTDALVIRNGYVMTMDPSRGDLARADVLVRGGRIAAIGPDLDAGGARAIDAAGTVVMPGFVDTHSHLYVTTMRGQFRNAGGKFFPVSSKLAAVMTPQDIRVAMRTGALELLSQGITTTADFFDNVIVPEHGQAGLDALDSTGIRALMFFGGPDKTTTQSIDMAQLARLAGQRKPDDLVQLGLAWRLPRKLDDAQNWSMRQKEYDTARQLNLPIQVHVSGEPKPMFDALVQRKLLYPGLTVVHATDATSGHLAALDAAGGSLSLTPISEHRVGYGLTRLEPFKPVKRQGLGIDGNALAGRGDMFATMRLAALTWSGDRKDEAAVSPRALLELATRGGAETLGLGKVTGSLAVGMRADIQVIDMNTLNMAGFAGGDPAALVVYSASDANVRDVLVDGKVRKLDGKLVGVDLPAVLNEARASARGLVERADAK